MEINNVFFSKGDKAPTVELLWLKLKGTVKNVLSYRKYKPPKFCNFSEKKNLALASDSFPK